MNQPTIVLVHRLTNRVRFKLSHPLRDKKETKEFLIEYEGINKFEYNEITRSILVEFNEYKVELNEVIMRLSISYSKQYDKMPINVFILKKKKNTSLVYYSIGSILLAGAAKNFTPFNNKEVVNFLSWLAVGTTAFAIIDHGYKELNEKGAFDPELVSFVYLLNSIKNGKLLTGSFVTWLTAFGRHSLDLPYQGITIKVKEFKNIYTEEPQYNLSVYQGARVNTINSDNKISIIRDLISKFIDDKQFKFKKGYFMGKKMMLDSKEVGVCEVMGNCNNILINNNNSNFKV